MLLERPRFSKWIDVGVHPTPETMVSEFADFVALSWIERNPEHAIARGVRVLDACSGDGRLGVAVCQRLREDGFRVELTLVEVDTQRSQRAAAALGNKISVINADFISWTSHDTFDLVVSNPPYESLDVNAASKYGLTISDARAGGWNLYGLALQKCVSVCRDGGAVALIAPFGWIRNVRFAELRAFVAEQADLVQVRAFEARRNLFPNVTQEIGFQFFGVVDRKRVRQRLSAVSLAYGDAAAQAVPLFQIGRDKKAVGELTSYVGPLVWNRSKDALSSNSKGLLVINGGNIGQDNRLIWPDRYRDRQYVDSDWASELVSRGPLLLLKRSMRGVPGAWIVDYVLIKSREFECVAENHVIVVELPSSVSAERRDSLVGGIIERVKSSHRDHGHPNISVRLLQAALRDLNENRDQSRLFQRSGRVRLVGSKSRL